MKYRTLGKTGLKVSALSYGASPLGSVFREVDESEGARCVHTALDLGINLIDVSPYYGITKAETVLGKSLKGIARDRYILATKVGRYGDRDFDFSAQRVTKSIEESLGRLGVDHVDILNCHDIEFGDMRQVVDETLPALRRLRDAGKCRFIGVTGLPLGIFKFVADRTEIDTILSYCHYALNDTALEGLLDYLEQKRIGVINASPLSMGLLSNRQPPAWHPAPQALKDACARAARMCRDRGADITKLAVQFSVANEKIPTTLVGTASAENITRNVKWADEPMDQELLADVLAVLKPVHNLTWESGRAENHAYATV